MLFSKSVWFCVRNKGNKTRKVLEDSSNIQSDDSEEFMFVAKKTRDLRSCAASDDGSDDSDSESSLFHVGHDDDGDGGSKKESQDDDDDESTKERVGGVNSTLEQDDDVQSETAVGDIEIDEQQPCDSASGLTSANSSQGSHSVSHPMDPLKGNGVMYERDMLKFVVHEVF